MSFWHWNLTIPKVGLNSKPQFWSKCLSNPYFLRFPEMLAHSKSRRIQVNTDFSISQSMSVLVVFQSAVFGAMAIEWNWTCFNWAFGLSSRNSCISCSINSFADNLLVWSPTLIAWKFSSARTENILTFIYSTSFVACLTTEISGGCKPSAGVICYGMFTHVSQVDTRVCMFHL